MESVVYHGSPISGLKWILPKPSTHGSYVYGSYHKAVALFFLGRGNGDMDVVKGIKNGVPFLVERRSHCFEMVYGGSGSLYELDGDYFKKEKGLWEAEVVSDRKEPVKKEWKIASILEELEQLAQEGVVTLYRYPDRPKEIPLDNRDLIDRYLLFEKQGHTGAVDQLLRIYPEFSSEVLERQKKS